MSFASGLEPADGSNELELCQECKKLAYGLYGGYCQNCYRAFEAEEMRDREAELMKEEGHG